jgi:hypothetical protein
VPASFDEEARELTRRAAEQAGLQHVTLLEEPQAAFYAWLEGQGDGWRRRIRVGDLVLVCDVGGGTTDFSLILVSEDGGELSLKRVAVGDHILLGGDNMDLALARILQQRLESEGGAAYYGKARLGQGVRIRSGASRTYFIGIESSMPAIPGMEAPLKALCVVPFGMEEGTDAAIPAREFGLVVGEPAEFRFLSSTIRKQDHAGTRTGNLCPMRHDRLLAWRSVCRQEPVS